MKDADPDPPRRPHAKLWIADPELYARFKEAARRRQMTLREAACEAVRLYLMTDGQDGEKGGV